MNTKPPNNHRDAANSIARKLINEGIIVHRCDAVSGSIYLRLDYGALGTIRIADHAPVSKSSRYRFQIGSYVKQMDTRSSPAGKIRTYPINCHKNLVADILSEREFRLDNYGMPIYLAAMAGLKPTKKDKKLGVPFVDEFWLHPTTRRIK